MTKSEKKVPQNKPLPLAEKLKKQGKANTGSGGAGDAALTALAGHNARGRSQFLIGKVQTIEAIESQKRQLTKQINQLYADIKQNGFSVTATRRVVNLRRLDKEERAHLEENIAIVKEALGEQLTLWDRAAMGETREDPDAKFPAVAGAAGEEEDDGPKVVRANVPDPEQVALERAAASSIADDQQAAFH